MPLLLSLSFPYPSPSIFAAKLHIPRQLAKWLFHELNQCFYLATAPRFQIGGYADRGLRPNRLHPRLSCGRTSGAWLLVPSVSRVHRNIPVFVGDRKLMRKFVWIIHQLKQLA